jgi:hypothetical protein
VRTTVPLALVNSMQTVVDWLKHWWKRWWLYLTLISALILIILVPRSVMNLIRAVGDWVENWWTDLQPGDRGTWVGGLATFLTLAVTLIFSAVNWARQRSRAAERAVELQEEKQRLQEEKQRLQAEEQEAARRAHAEKFSCWVAGRIKKYDGDLQVQEGHLVVTLANASMQPFTEGAVEVELKEPQGSPSTCRFKFSVVPPGMSWFAFDNNVRSWTRDSHGELIGSKKLDRLDKRQDATPVSLHHGDPAEKPGLNDAWAEVSF